MVGIFYGMDKGRTTRDELWYSMDYGMNQGMDSRLRYQRYGGPPQTLGKADVRLELLEDLVGNLARVCSEHGMGSVNLSHEIL